MIPDIKENNYRKKKQQETSKTSGIQQQKVLWS